MRLRNVLGLALVLVASNGCGGGGVGATAGSGGARGAEAAQAARSDRVLVKLTGPGAVTSVLSLLGSSLLWTIEETGWITVRVPSGYDAASFVAELEKSAYVVAAALDLELDVPEGEGSTIPAGGTLLASQIPAQDELERIGAPVARTRATGDGVTVAIVDSGILASLDGVSGHVLTSGYDFLAGDADPTDATNGIDDDGDGHVDEQYAHGTFVASLVLAVAPDVQILPIRVLDADGRGTASGIASGIVYAVQHGADVINLSVRVPPGAFVVGDAIAYARSQGVQVVAAAGNSGSPDVAPPSQVQDAIVVTAVDADDVKPGFASHGSLVDLSAPGVDLSGSYPASPGTAVWSGTSFSTALVTGACALLQELHPSWDLDDVADHLAETAVPIDDLNEGLGGELGAGRLDLDAATAP